MTSFNCQHPEFQQYFGVLEWCWLHIESSKKRQRLPIG